MSRINALLRRSRHFQQAPGDLCSNGITLQLLEGRAYKGGVPVKLTAAEYKPLRFFMEQPGIILSPEQIMSRLWECDGNFVDGSTPAVYIRRLRAKIEDGLAQGRVSIITSGETFVRLTGVTDYSLVMIQTTGDVTDEAVAAMGDPGFPPAHCRGICHGGNAGCHLRACQTDAADGSGGNH